ncbi:proprotein convertase P-domain-containing protein [Flavobacterium sp.]|uniref:proprotein convertase P-domain-containing protein n=1 Tax=Flavobacterium sp. TaxID=239 RepID=UPI00286E8D01|nr:proprotein convertase P-domain-containing protein [Flavobacterium sp.]
MKTLKSIIIIVLLILSLSCNRDDKEPQPIADTKLILPAMLENNTQISIPDATVSGTTLIPGIIASIIEIDKDGIIQDPSKIFLELDLSHSFAGDIVVELIAPSGENCGIIKRIGTTNDTSPGSSINLVLGNKLKFNSLFTTFFLPQVSTFIVAGNYAPSRGVSSIPFSVPMTSLNTFFMDKNIKGKWTLKVYDYQNNDIGKLISWKLYFDTGALK